MRGGPLSSRAPVGLAGEHEYAAAVHSKTMGEALMAQDEVGQRGGAEAVLRWRAPLETVALILLAATGVSIVGGIVNGVFTGHASGWERLALLGFNVVIPWHVAVLGIAVALLLATRIPFPPDTRGAATARPALLGAMVLAGIVAVCALLGFIGAIGRSGEFTGPTVPEKIGEVLQFLGGGGVAAAVALLALRGQSLLPAPVRPVAAPPPPAPAPAAPAPSPPTAPASTGPGAPGWAADPYGRHQWRYWDGARWTDQVADGSTQSTDPAR
jgi:hypothetical protein